MVEDVIEAPATECYGRTLTMTKLLTAASEHALNRTLLEHCLAKLPRGARGKRLKIEEELGIAMAQLGEYRKSSGLMMAVLRAKQLQHGARSQELCHCLDGLAHNYYQLQDFRSAAEFANRSLQHTPLNRPTERISRLQNLAAIEFGGGELEHALARCHDAYNLAKTIYGDNHPITTQAEGNLGMLEYARGEFDSALAHFYRILAYYKRTFGEDHQETWSTTNNLALVLGDSSDYVNAAVYYQRGFDLARRMFGSQHLNTMISAINLAHCLTSLGRTQDAYLLYNEWLPVKVALLGEDHPSTFQTKARVMELARILKDA
jgi:tetratricopeptide (TPR) repeat protein